MGLRDGSRLKHDVEGPRGRHDLGNDVKKQ